MQTEIHSPRYLGSEGAWKKALSVMSKFGISESSIRIVGCRIQGEQTVLEITDNPDFESPYEYRDGRIRKK